MNYKINKLGVLKFFYRVAGYTLMVLTTFLVGSIFIDIFIGKPKVPEIPGYTSIIKSPLEMYWEYIKNPLNLLEWMIGMSVITLIFDWWNSNAKHQINSGVKSLVKKP